MALKIGFAQKYFTLWNVSEPYKHYFGEKKWDFEWRVNYHYIRNLSKDEATAKNKAHKAGATNLVVDNDLRGRGGRDFYTTGKKGTDRPGYIFPTGIHRFGVGDIREFGLRQVNTFIVPGSQETSYVSAEDRIAAQANADDIKALWSMYLKKDIIFNGEHSVNPDWKRPCVYARMQLVKLGVLVKHDGQYMSVNAVEKYNERKLVDQLIASGKNGHHQNDKDKVLLKVKLISEHGFEGFYGYTHILTFIDDQQRLFKYMGGARPNIESKHEFIQIKATIKHDEYQGVKETKLQRISIIK